MAKKAAKIAVETAPSGDTAMSIKMTVSFRDWLNELAEHDRSTAVQVMEKGAVLYAKQVGFAKPAPSALEDADMPGPTTEVLNEDVKELKGDLRDIRSNLDVLKADVHRIDVSVAELRAEFRFAKWLLGLLLAMTISGIGGGIWQAATLTSEVKHLAGIVAAQKAPPAESPR